MKKFIVILLARFFIPNIFNFLILVLSTLAHFFNLNLFIYFNISDACFFIISNFSMVFLDLNY